MAQIIPDTIETIHDFNTSLNEWMATLPEPGSALTIDLRKQIEEKYNEFHSRWENPIVGLINLATQYATQEKHDQIKNMWLNTISMFHKIQRTLSSYKRVAGGFRREAKAGSRICKALKGSRRLGTRSKALKGSRRLGTRSKALKGSRRIRSRTRKALKGSRKTLRRK